MDIHPIVMHYMLKRYPFPNTFPLHFCVKLFKCVCMDLLLDTLESLLSRISQIPFHLIYMSILILVRYKHCNELVFFKE